MSRLKTIEACAGAIEEIAFLDRELARIQAELDVAVAAAKARAEAEASPLNERRQARSIDVEEFCTVRRQVLTQGERQSIEFATGGAGWRRGQPRVEVDPGRLKAILELLSAPKLKHLLRFKDPEIDKRAIAKQPELVKGIRGIKVLPALESFWIRPTDLALAEGPAAPPGRAA